MTFQQMPLHNFLFKRSLRCAKNHLIFHLKACRRAVKKSAFAATLAVAANADFLITVWVKTASGLNPYRYLARLRHFTKSCNLYSRATRTHFFYAKISI